MFKIEIVEIFQYKTFFFAIDPKSWWCDEGLTVILDAHSDIFSAGSVNDDTQGFLGLVKPRGSFPLTSIGSFDIRPGIFHLLLPFKLL